MVFWHVGGAIAIFRAVFRDPNVDLRFLALGALLPDLIDKPIGMILFRSTFGSGRIFGHTLLFGFLVMICALVFTQRGTSRQRWMAAAIGVLLHLVLDFMWIESQILWWPGFGWSFPKGVDDYWQGMLARFLNDPWLMGQEIAGLVYLIWLYRKARNVDPDIGPALLGSGRIGV